jgi:voltage-gated potassium channel Kch
VLIGVFWGFVYLLLHDASPGAFALDPSQGSAEVQLRYFSLMTLTTVGYGDIVPKSGEARALATIESLLGQIYLTAIVARLVGISIAIPMPGGEARGPLNRPVDAPDADADGR